MNKWKQEGQLKNIETARQLLLTSSNPKNQWCNWPGARGESPPGKLNVKNGPAAVDILILVFFRFFFCVFGVMSCFCRHPRHPEIHYNFFIFKCWLVSPYGNPSAKLYLSLAQTCSYAAEVSDGERFIHRVPKRQP